MPDDGASRSAWRTGCLVLGGFAILLVAAIVSTLGVAVAQNRAARGEPVVVELPLAEPVADVPAAAVIVEIDILVGEAIVLPAVGDEIRIDADFDPAEYRLEQSSTEREGTIVHRIALEPLGSATWALLRAKVGRELPILRVELPTELELALDVSVRRSYLTAEIGGLELREAAFLVESGGLKVTVTEPTVRPLERFSVESAKGAVEVALLGNASPRESSIRQRLGGIDLDLRGAWRQDARVGVEMRLTGGTLWLPRTVDVRGADAYRRFHRDSVEIPRPTLTLDLPDRSRSLIVID